MPLEKLVDTDLLVIGGGVAGCFAATKAREMNLNVTVVDKGNVGSSGGGTYATQFSSFDPERGCDFNTAMNVITRRGEYINNQEWVKVLLADTLARLKDLVSWGAPLLEVAGEVVHRPLVLDQVEFLLGKIMPPVRKKLLESGSKILDRVMITDLLKSDGKVVGAVGFHCRDGDFYTFQSKATIIATGSGRFKQPGSPSNYWTSDGESMSYRAGASVTGKEFGGKSGGMARYYPVPILTGMAHGGRIVNAKGEEFRQKYIQGSNPMAKKAESSDRYFEVHAGHGGIFWDLDSMTTQEQKRLKGHIKATLADMIGERLGLDFTKGKIEIVGGTTAGHGGGGIAGVWVNNTRCETSIPGLYAAGDGAGTRYAGASQPFIGWGLGGASVTGYRAGEAASEYALRNSKTAMQNSVIEKYREITYAPICREGGFNPRWVTQMLQNIMVPYYILQIKHGQRLQAALTLVEFLKHHLVPRIRVSDFHELRLAHEVRNMVLNAEMILRASLFRTESRGDHFREDYPRRNDPEWLAWVVVKDDQGEMKASKVPIPKEWWPDLSKPYEERYDLKFLIEE